MRSAPPLAFALVLAWAPILFAARQEHVGTLTSHATSHQDDTTSRQECGRAVVEPPTGQDLESYFDDLRVKYGILNSSYGSEDGLVDPSTCTKKDICLLMRQLDMDFYERARAGTLTDHDYDSPPEVGWHAHLTCETSTNRGYSLTPVRDSELCSRAVKAEGITKEVKNVSKDNYPTGCVIIDRNGYKKGYMNSLETTAKAGMHYRGKHRWPLEIKQLCAMDRSLSESAAAYYSPYKLKPSMEGREAHSTSCSFGMMAYLAKLQETMSPCARIITYQTDSRFSSAAHALEVAARLESLSDKEGSRGQLAAKKIRQYVETVRAKYVLIDTIANHWCPGVWTAAKATPGATCDAPRVMAWTEQGVLLAEARAEEASSTSSSGRAGGRKGSGRQPKPGKAWAQAGNQGLLNDLDDLLAEFAEEDVRAAGLAEQKDANGGASDSSGKPIKIALNEASCDAFADESLASILVGKGEAPPDFFRDATAALQLGAKADRESDVHDLGVQALRR